MNNQPGQPPMNGNDDLAKTLNEGLQFEETPMPGAPTPPPTAPNTPAPAATATDDNEDNGKMPSLDPDAGGDDDLFGPPPSMASAPPIPEPKDTKPEPKVEHHKNHDKPDSPKASGDLEGIKASALEALRPLVGKLKLPAEERFDTLLLIIRSTDDQSLLNQAHEAAKQITDDTRRAQALLDVIKEIDYFSSKR